jgi:hypothetical protein
MVHNESENIGAAVEFDDVADLLPSKENVNIRVKVLRLWRVPAFFNHSETNSIEMVLIDCKVWLKFKLFCVFDPCILFCFSVLFSVVCLIYFGDVC